MLRFFFEFRMLFQAASTPGGLSAALIGRPGFNPSGVTDLEEVFSDNTEGPIAIEIDIQSHLVTKLDEQGVPFADRLSIIFPRQSGTWSAKVALGGSQIPFVPGWGLTEKHINEGSGTQRVNMEPLFDACRILGSTLYIGPFRNALNVGSLPRYYDIQAGQAFVERWRALQTGTNNFEKRMAYRVTEEIKDLFGFRDLEIHASEDATTLQLFINGNPYRLYSVGSGITQFILVLANAATSSPELILIDEPELNLHPALQVAFMSALGRYAKTGIVFATHNIGLARASSQAIYSFHKVAEGETDLRRYEGTVSLVELLGEMSFSAYQDIGYRKLLLVEGPSEVKTIRQFLRWYEKDHLVVLIPLGGSSIINGKSQDQLAELTRLCEEVYALIDSERSGPDAALGKERADFVANCDALKIKCCVLSRRSTENYLSDAAVKAVKGPKYSALESHQRLSEIDPSWGKDENWRIASEMEASELEGTDLGEFLKAL